MTKGCLVLAFVVAVFAAGCQHKKACSCFEKLAVAGRPELLKYYESHREKFKPEELLPIAICYAQERQYDKARSVYEEYVQAVPLDARAWRGLGNIDLLTGQPERAITNYSKALSLGDTESTRLLAAAYYATGQFEALRAMAENLEEYALKQAPSAAERFEALDLLLLCAMRAEPPDIALIDRAIALLKKLPERWPNQTKDLVRQAERKRVTQ